MAAQTGSNQVTTFVASGKMNDFAHEPISYYCLYQVFLGTLEIIAL